MEKQLLKIGFTTKEAQVYLALLELGNQSAAVVAKKLGMPKSTALFVLENLAQRGYLKKTKRGLTQFFFADPVDLEQSKRRQQQEENETLEHLVPLLQEFKSPFSSQPKLTFYEGVAGCKRAYQQLLESRTEILEFGIHKDLEEKFGAKFMDNFIAQRCKKKITLRAISSENAIDRDLQKLDVSQLREQRFLPDGSETYSSIAIWENKVLLLNLHQDAFGVLVENEEFSRTLRTIFTVLYKCLPS